MDPIDISAFLRGAVQALQNAHDNLPNPHNDLQVRNNVIALVIRLQEASQACSGARVKAIPLRNVASLYAFKILCQECTILDSDIRFAHFLPIFLDAIDGLGKFAYGRGGQDNLRAHTCDVVRSAASLTPPRVLHKSSAFGILHGGAGALQPALTGSNSSLHDSTTCS